MTEKKEGVDIKIGLRKQNENDTEKKRDIKKRM